MYCCQSLISFTLLLLCLKSRDKLCTSSLLCNSEKRCPHIRMRSCGFAANLPKQVFLINDPESNLYSLLPCIFSCLLHWLLLSQLTCSTLTEWKNKKLKEKKFCVFFFSSLSVFTCNHHLSLEEQVSVSYFSYVAQTILIWFQALPISATVLRGRDWGQAVIVWTDWLLFYSLS